MLFAHSIFTLGRAAQLSSSGTCMWRVTYCMWHYWNLSISLFFSLEWSFIGISLEASLQQHRHMSLSVFCHVQLCCQKAWRHRILMDQTIWEQVFNSHPDAYTF